MVFSSLSQGWLTSNVNTGVVVCYPIYMTLQTGVTANSRGLAFANIYGLNSGTVHFFFVDWTKYLELSFIVSRMTSDAEAIARVQLKEASVGGVLAERGIGVQISNYTMIGESYGTVRGTTGTLLILSHQRNIHVRIVKTAAEVQFWVNGVLVETLVGTAVPNVEGGASANLVISIINGATGTINARFDIGNIQIVQEW